MEFVGILFIITCLFGSTFCVPNRAFRDLNMKVNLLKASFQRDVDEIKASFQRDVDDLKFEVLDLRTLLHLERERTKRLEELLNGTGDLPDIGWSTLENAVDRGDVADLNSLTEDVSELKKESLTLTHVQESLINCESDVRVNREDIQHVRQVVQNMTDIIKSYQEDQDIERSKTIVAVLGKAFKGEKERAREFERVLVQKITNESKAAANDIENLRRRVDIVADDSLKNARGLEDMQQELKHDIQKIKNESEVAANDVRDLRRDFDTVADDTDKHIRGINDMQQDFAYAIQKITNDSIDAANDVKDLQHAVDNLTVDIEGKQHQLNHARMEANESIIGMISRLHEFQQAYANTDNTSVELALVLEEELKKVAYGEWNCREAIRAGGKRMAELLYSGVTVKRGEDWKWNNQDGGGLGTVAIVGIDRLDTMWVQVLWDNGYYKGYRMGLEGAYDLMIVEEKYDFSRC